jgi:5-methylcytosine-specific restriction endonuclease McrA
MSSRRRTPRTVNSVTFVTCDLLDGGCLAWIQFDRHTWLLLYDMADVLSYGNAPYELQNAVTDTWTAKQEATDTCACICSNGSIIKQLSAVKKTVTSNHTGVPLISPHAMRHHLLQLSTMHHLPRHVQLLDALWQAEVQWLKGQMPSERKAKRKTISETERRVVAASQHWKCAVCGNALPAHFEVDHKRRWADGGSEALDNKQALCSNCHTAKSYVERQTPVPQRLEIVTIASLTTAATSPPPHVKRSRYFSPPPEEPTAAAPAVEEKKMSKAKKKKKTMKQKNVTLDRFFPSNGC